MTKGRRVDVNRPIVKYSGSCNILFRVNDGFEFIVTLSSFFVFIKFQIRVERYMEHLSISDAMKNKTLSFSSFFKYDCFEGNICIRLLYKVYD